MEPVDPDLGPTRARPGVVAAVAVGGALGAPARYGVAQVIHVSAGTFPWATFMTNITGSFVLGVLLIVLVDRYPPTRYLRPFVATGFLGAFTTFSTLVVDVDVLTKDGHALLAAAYAVTSTAAGLLAVWTGITMGRRVRAQR